MIGQKMGRAWRAPATVALAAVAFTAMGAVPAQAGIIWDESRQGDLAELLDYSQSNALARGTFTDVGVLSAEVSTVVGRSARTTMNATTTVDGDALRFTVPPGMIATVVAFTHDLPAGVREFLRERSDGGADYLSSLADPPVLLPGGSQHLLTHFGVTGGLESGSYVLSFENGATSTSTMGYGLDIVIAPVPAPGGAAALAMGFVGLLIRGRRRVQVRGRAMTVLRA